MDKRRSAIAIILGLTLSGCAAPLMAASSDPTVVAPASYQVGDKLELRGTRTEAGTTHATRVVSAIGPPGVAIDAYGIERAAVPIRSDEFEDGELHRQSTCHVLSGGREEVRQDVGASHVHASQFPPGLPLAASESTFSLVVFENCDVAVDLGARPLREGDTLAARDVLNGMRWGKLNDSSDPQSFWWNAWRDFAGTSAPATATDFEGRAALRFTFTVARAPQPGRALAGEASLTLVVADGLPGFVASTFRVRDPDGNEFALEDRLVGYERGAGAPLRDVGARLPTHDPRAPPRAYDPLAIEDAAWPWSFRFADAMAALRADPTIGLDAYLREHPDAVLYAAVHDHPARDGVDAEYAEETWELFFGDDSSTLYVGASQRAIEIAGVRVARLPPVSYRGGEPWHGPAPHDAVHRLPAAAAPSDVLTLAAGRGGVDPARAAVAMFWLAEGGERLGSVLWLRDNITASSALAGATDPTSTHVVLEPSSGRLLYVAGRTSRPVVPLQPAPPAVGRALAPAPAGLDAGTLAGGLAIAVLLAFAARILLAPLYTRLVRSKLLDHPARATLYESIRRDPGVHQGALVDLLDAGNGAARHHLRTLIAHRLVFTVGAGKHLRYFASGGVPPADARRMGMLMAGSLRGVYDVFAAHPELTLRAAAARLGMSAPSVYRAKKRLEREGLLPVPAGLLAVRVGEASGPRAEMEAK